MLTKRPSNAVVAEKQSRVERNQSKKEKPSTSRANHAKSTPDTTDKVVAKKSRQQQKAEQKKEKRKQKKPRRRIFPIWLRIIVVILLCAAGLALGAMVGYGVIGDGDPTDALKKETWQHIIDIVIKKE